MERPEARRAEDMDELVARQPSKEAFALAADLARKIGRSGASHEDKFDALVAVLAALGAPPIRQD